LTSLDAAPGAPVLDADLQLKEVHHIGVTVADLDRSLAFYRALTGGEPLLVSPMRGGTVARHMGLDTDDLGLRFAMVQLGNTILELIEYERPESNRPARVATDVGFIHIAFEVADLDAVHRRLAESGVPFVAPPHTFTSADGAPDVIGATFAYFHDPDGVQLEVFQAAPHDR